MAVLAATDFFTVEVLKLKGLMTYYVLFFIHLESRRICLPGMTRHPDHEWMAALLLFPLSVMATTLPQALLLWSEPNLSPSEEELSSVPPADHITKSKRVGVGR